MLYSRFNLVPLFVLVVILAGCGSGVDSDLQKHHLHLADLVVGDGEIAVPGDYALVHIATWIYADGGQGRELQPRDDDPRTVHLVDGEVMPGLLEGFVGMREGGRRLLVIAPEKITRRFRPGELLSDEAIWCEIELASLARVRMEDLQVGEGDQMGEGDYVEIDYAGWFADESGAKGEQFLATTPEDKPAGLMIGAGMVNEGLDRGLVGIQVGGTRRVVVPPALAYGEKGTDGVPPNTTLIYEVTVRRKLSVGIEDLRVGEGDAVEPGQQVELHIKGWLRNDDGSKGELFQDSSKLSSPYLVLVGTFRIQPGLELGIRGIHHGGLRRLTVPAALAFGARGWHRGDRTLVPPDADVIYEIEIP